MHCNFIVERFELCIHKENLNPNVLASSVFLLPPHYLQRFKSSSKQSTSSETDHHHHHRFGSLIPRLGRKYRSLSFDSGLLLIVNQRFESPSPTRLVMATSALNSDRKIVTGPAGYVLEDVPHFSDYIPNPPTYPNPLQDNAAYSVVKQYFVDEDDTVPQKIVVHPDSPRGTHFRRAGPRLNTVIREIVCGLSYMYGVKKILGIEGGYRGFYARNTIDLDSKTVNDIHKRGGTILGTSRGGHDTTKIVDSIQDRGINQVYIIGGDGSQKGAAVIFEEIRRRGLKVAVAGIPKTIDNDIPIIDRSLGFDTAVEEAQRAINAAHVEATSFENGIGLVKLMGRYSGFIAMYATLASRDVDCCLIPESPFFLKAKAVFSKFIGKRLKENGHMVIVIAEGAGQDLLSESNEQSTTLKDASGNKLLQDVGLWISQRIKDHFAKKMTLNLKYIDPTYMIRAVPSNASDNVCCTLLAQSAVHGVMAGYNGFTVGLVNGRHTYIPFYRITEKQNKVVITDRMWARLLSSTNQPSFMKHDDNHEPNHSGGEAGAMNW
ncbi:hypothetical protein Bca52824_091073 [Brassica carinata]|uniref:Phosphofructokinase domain-containing protein n=1 Tax=Brassica carinata TaxID=52824 RepID=A0A8X7NVH3_BRACI|nr:hypothetical protein Bca52824_091073 [Brassica carinata]